MNILVNITFIHKKTKKILVIKNVEVAEPENWDEDHQVTQFLSALGNHSTYEYNMESWDRVIVSKIYSATTRAY